MSDEQHLTLEQAADRLQVSVRTVRRAIRDRGLPAFQVCGRGTWRIRKSALDEWIEARTADEQRSAPSPTPPRGGQVVVPLPATPRKATRRGAGALAVTPDMGRTA